MDCREAERFIDLAIDGEIEPVDAGVLDGHLGACSVCRTRYHLEGKCASTLRARLHEAAEAQPCPSALRARILGQVEAERQTRHRFGWSRVVSVALGASMIAVLSWSGASRPALVPEEAVTRHSGNLPPEVRAGDPTRVQRFLATNLRYPVEVPRFEQRPGVRLVGARLSNLDDREAAYVMYDRRGAKLSLFAYPKPARFSRPADFEEVQVGSHVVLVGKRRGYNVVSWEEGDVAYSLVSDIDPHEMIDLATNAR